MSPRARLVKKIPLGKVLFVEDDELFGERIQKNLQRHEVECDWFKTFGEAKEALAKIEYHAVIADIYLENHQALGLELIKAAKDYGISSIIITNALDMDIAKTGLNNGADQLLEKPFEANDLVKILNDIWENPRGLIGRRERFFETNALTNKEKEIARLILKGLSNQEIADVSSTSLATIKFYNNQIFEKCSVSSRAELFNSVFPT